MRISERVAPGGGQQLEPEATQVDLEVLREPAQVIVPETPTTKRIRSVSTGKMQRKMPEPEVEPPPMPPIPAYKRLRNNKYSCQRSLRVAEEPDAIKCNCEDECNIECQNFMLNVECTTSNCVFGADHHGRCHNRFFKAMDTGLLEDVVEVFHTGEHKGYGLHAARPVFRGQLVVEYVGRVVPEEKIRTWRYAMQLHSGLAIDASAEGGIGRFVNHSCQPNCAAERWNVGGEQRIGLFALKSIAPHEEITYCYSRQVGSAFGEELSPEACHCYAKTCTGFIGYAPSCAKTVAAKLAASGSHTAMQLAKAVNPAAQVPATKSASRPVSAEEELLAQWRVSFNAAKVGLQDKRVPLPPNGKRKALVAFGGRGRGRGRSS